MSFSSYIFVFCFLPLVLIGYYCLGRRKNGNLRQLFLIIATLVFYGYSNWSYVWVLLCSVCFNYIIVSRMGKSEQKKSWFFLGLAFNIGLLGFFKYYDFFVENLNNVFYEKYPILGIVPPLGISFYTWQQIAFLVSVYGGKEETENFVRYCSFVLFFPQLISGPIVQYQELVPQLKRSINGIAWEQLSAGLFLFSIGIFKKTVIADSLAVIVNNGYGTALHAAADAWLVSLSYTLQIYFDFSGYSDMAIGLARLFRVELPVNFDSPYQSKSISEYWRRWHITLGRVLRTCVYFPLGGSRKGEWRTYLNLVLTFLLSGLWHGAAWTYVLWGGLHGLIMALERCFWKQLETLPGWIRQTGTFLLVNFLFVFFRSPSLKYACQMLKCMLKPDVFGFWGSGVLLADGIIGIPVEVGTILIVCFLSVLLWAVMRLPSSQTIASRWRPDVRHALLCVGLLAFSILHFSRGAVFIYFNF